MTGTTDGTFYYYANCTDTNNNSNVTDSRTITIEQYIIIENVSAHPLYGDTAAFIIWDTDKLSNSTVNYGTTTALGVISSNGTPGASHNVTLTGLTPHEPYYYNITSCTAVGTCNMTGPYEFISDGTPPIMAFVPPTPANGQATNSSSAAMNLLINENVTSCTLYASGTPSVVAIGTGNEYTCYILSNGNSVCYGDNSYNQWENYTGGDAVAVAGGSSHTCYLLSSGSSVCYGVNANGYVTNYSGGDAIAVSTGKNDMHTCYLLLNGNSICYGAYDWGEAISYTGGDAIAVSTGAQHTCYLLSNGNSTCYGDNGNGQADSYTGGDAIDVSAGGWHTCYLLSSGNSICYGENGGGQATDYTGGDAVAVSAGYWHTCYLLSNGNSQCYGWNGYGQSRSYTGGDAVAVSARFYHTCYLLSNGTSVCYGKNDYGQSTNRTAGDIMALRNNSYLHSFAMDILNNDASTAANVSISGFTDDNLLYSATCTDTVNLSNSTSVRLFSFETYLTITNVAGTALPGETSMGIAWNTNHNATSVVDYGTTEDLGNTFSDSALVARHNSTVPGLVPHTLYYFNVTSCNALGVCNTSGPYNLTTDVLPLITFLPPTPAPNQTASYPDVTFNATVSENVTSCSLGILDVNALWKNISHLGTAGYERFGRFDYNSSIGLNNYSSFNMMNRNPISTGFYPSEASCYVLSNGNSTCYGQNYSGSTNPYTGGDAVAAATGTTATCYLLTNGNSTCFGGAGYGEADPYTGGDAIAVSAGAAFTCYLLSNGNSTCYGYGGDGRADNYTGGDAISLSCKMDVCCYLRSNGTGICYGNNDSGTAVEYNDINAIAVSANGYSHNVCFLLSNGNSSCYGPNGNGQANNYTGGNAIALGVSSYHTCYLLSNGTSVCYGWNGQGRATPYTGGDAIAMSIGGSHSCYLRSNGTSVCYGTNSYGGESTPYTGGDIKIPFDEVPRMNMTTSNADMDTSANLTVYGIPDGTYSYSANCTDMTANTSKTADRTFTMQFWLYAYNISARTMPGETSAYVYWLTNNPANGTVNYGETTALGSEASNDTFSVAHNVTLTGLTPKTKYHFNVSYCISPGGCNTTGKFTFVTDITPPGMAFVSPTPDDNATVSDRNVTINATVSENVTSCRISMGSLTLNDTGLWENVRHLGITGGLFDYNASLGDNGYSSFNMMNRQTVSGGYYCTCYVLSNGNSACYGENSAGQATNYTGGDAIAVATGYQFTCYLLSNGSSKCYGDNTYGQATNYNGGDAVAVSSSEEHTCYLLSSGNSVCHGNNWSGEINPYTGGDAIAVSAYWEHTCYLLSNGNSVCYGDTTCSGGSTCTGDGGQSTNYTGGDAIAVSAGQYHTCYLLPNGNSTCYGSTDGGGRNYTGGDAIAISSAYYQHTCYLLSNGTSVCYGNNDYGQATNYTGGNIKIPFARLPGIGMTVANADAATTAHRTISNLSNGNYTYGISCTDTNGNSNITENRTFTVAVTSNATEPQINITSPLGTINSSGFTLSFDLSGADINTSTCWYSLDNASNVDLPNCTGTAVSSSYGSHCITAYVNKSGTIKSSRSCFTLQFVSNPSTEGRRHAGGGMPSLDVGAEPICEAGIGTFELTVIDENGSTVAGATVSVAGIEGSKQTDSGGKAVFTGLLEPYYDVNATKEGYATAYSVFLTRTWCGWGWGSGLPPLNMSTFAYCDLNGGVADIYVTDENGTAVEGALASIMGTNETKATNENGMAEFAMLASSPQLIANATKDGYAAAYGQVSIDCVPRTLEIAAEATCVGEGGEGGIINVSLFLNSMPAAGMVYFTGTTINGLPFSTSNIVGPYGHNIFYVDNGVYDIEARMGSSLNASQQVFMDCRHGEIRTTYACGSQPGDGAMVNVMVLRNSTPVAAAVGISGTTSSGVPIMTGGRSGQRGAYFLYFDNGKYMSTTTVGGEELSDNFTVACEYGSNRPPKYIGTENQTGGNVSIGGNITSNVTGNATGNITETGGLTIGGIRIDTAISEAMNVLVSAAKSPLILLAILALAIGWYIQRVRKKGRFQRQYGK
jgi:uncharacterized cupin superfamily protein